MRLNPNLISRVLVIALTSVLSGYAQDPTAIPPHGKLKPLFNGKNLEGFDTFLAKHGINQDPDKVFQSENGLLHISGTDYGGLVTKRDYKNYYLRAEFKWGRPPSHGKARDSGLQYHISGPLAPWPTMLEFQINEGGTGDIWVIKG